MPNLTDDIPDDAPILKKAFAEAIAEVQAGTYNTPMDQNLAALNAPLMALYRTVAELERIVHRLES